MPKIYVEIIQENRKIYKFFKNVKKNFFIYLIKYNIPLLQDF